MFAYTDKELIELVAHTLHWGYYKEVEGLEIPPKPEDNNSYDYYCSNLTHIVECATGFSFNIVFSTSTLIATKVDINHWIVQ